MCVREIVCAICVRVSKKKRESVSEYVCLCVCVFMYVEIGKIIWGCP